MKKVIIAILIIFTLPAMAQRKNHIGIHLSPMLGLPSTQADFINSRFSFTAYNADISLIYSRDIGKILNLGVGAGIGTSKLNRVEFGETYSYPIMYVPAYVRAQVDFICQPTWRFYGAVKVGTRIGKTKDKDIWVSEENSKKTIYGYYPYIAHLTPSIGYEIPIKDHRLGLELSWDILWGAYNSLDFIEHPNSGEIVLLNYYDKRIRNSIGIGITYTL